MVLRVSNGAPFTVLAPPPLTRTGIRVEVYDRDDPNTLLDVLPDTRARQWLDELNGDGSGSFEIHALDPKLEAQPDLLTYGNIVRFYLNGVLRAGFRIEAIDRVQATEEDDAGRWLTVSGRGPIGILEDAITYPAGGLGGGTDPRAWANTYPGEIIRTLIAEAQTRTALIGVTTDFTDTTDSNSAPFTTEVTLEEEIGNDLLRIARRHAELAVDVWMTPQLVLKYANTRGVDRSLQLPSAGPVVLELGFDITELSNRELGRITNTALILTPNGLLERNDGTSQTTYNRREGFLSLGNITDSATVDFAAAALFAELSDPRGSATLELLDRAGASPYGDFDVGDYVLAPNPQGVLTKQRVRALSVTETPDGRVRYVPELSTVEEELEAKLNRWLAAMAKGTMGGDAGPLAEPNTVTTQGTTVIVDQGIADHVAGLPHNDELADLVDVDLTGLADGDMLYHDAGSNDWKRVEGTPTEGQAPVYQSDASVQWANVASSGAGTAEPFWMAEESVTNVSTTGAAVYPITTSAYSLEPAKYLLAARIYVETANPGFWYVEYRKDAGAWTSAEGLIPAGFGDHRIGDTRGAEGDSWSHDRWLHIPLELTDAGSYEFRIVVTSEGATVSVGNASDDRFASRILLTQQSGYYTATPAAISRLRNTGLSMPIYPTAAVKIPWEDPAVEPRPDELGVWTSGNTTRITIPRDGTYLITVNGAGPQNDTDQGDLRVQFFVNGSGIADGYLRDDTNDQWQTRRTTVLLREFSADDYVEIEVQGDAGTSQTWTFDAAITELGGGQAGPGTFQTPTLQNSWANYGSGFAAAGYRKDGAGMVHLKGLVKDGTMSTAIFTLPVGMRPTETLIIPVRSNGASGEVRIEPTGSVIAYTGSNAWLSLDGIGFLPV